MCRIKILDVIFPILYFARTPRANDICSPPTAPEPHVVEYMDSLWPKLRNNRALAIRRILVSAMSQSNDVPGVAGLRLLRITEVIDMVGASRASVYRWERAGDFPRRRKLSAHRVGWIQSEIETWI